MKSRMLLDPLERPGSRLFLPALALLAFVSSLVSAQRQPSVLVLYEDCGDAGGVATGLNGNGSNGSNGNRNVLLSLPCGTASSHLPTRRLRALTSSASPAVAVVVATCDVIGAVASALVGNGKAVRKGEEGEGEEGGGEGEKGALPFPLLPVPTSRCGRGRGKARWAYSPTAEPLQRLFDLTISWMTYHSWTKTTVLYDHSIDIKASVHLVKKFLDASIRLGTLLSFREIPQQETTSEASMGEMETMLETLLSSWEEEEEEEEVEGARHFVMIADESTVIRLLSLFSNRDTGKGESACDWLIFTSFADDFGEAISPAIGHRLYFVNATLDTDLRLRVLKAVRSAEALARDPSARRNTLEEEPVTVYSKPLDYSSMLKPPVEARASAQPRLVPVYRWTPPIKPSAQRSPGKLRALPFNQLYQLHGSHLIVATLRSEPFIEPLYKSSGDLAWNTSSCIPPHVTCIQPKAFVGFLVDMLDILKSQMNFTYTLYEVCDKSYGSLKNGRWTGVVGEVIDAHAHIGLANLGVNHARSQAVSFPRVSTSYGGAGIIMKRPQSTATDLLTVFFLPFSVSVWVCIAVFVPLAALAMRLATLPRRRLRQALGRCRGRPSAVSRRPGAEGSGGGEGPRTYPEENTPTPNGQDNASKRRRKSDSTELWSKREEKEDVTYSFLSGVWFATTVLLQQGQDQVPESGPGRLVFGTMWVASVVLYAAYTSNLVSYFTVTKMSLPFHNLEGLVKSNYKFGTRQGSIYLDNIMSMGTGVFEAASAKLESFGESVEMPTYEEAIKRTLQGSYAFIGDYVALDHYQRKDCSLVLLNQQFFETMSSIVLPHRSPILPAVNYHLSLMSERGVLQKLRQRWWRIHPCPDAVAVTAFKDIGMPEVCSALLVVAAGVVLSVAVCCLECRLRPPAARGGGAPEKADHAEGGVEETTPSSTRGVEKATPPPPPPLHCVDYDVEKTT